MTSSNTARYPLGFGLPLTPTDDAIARVLHDWSEQPSLRYRLRYKFVDANTSEALSPPLNYYFLSEEDARSAIAALSESMSKERVYAIEGTIHRWDSGPRFVASFAVYEP